MPELPDVMLYRSALRRFLLGQTIRSIHVKSPFVIRSFDPPIDLAEGRVVEDIDHLGKRIMFGLQPDLFLVFHLMIAGRFHWKKPQTRPASKRDLVAFWFDHGTLMLTEAGHKHRASIHVESDRPAAIAHDPGGINVLECDLEDFTQALTRKNRTLKRALTDPHELCGIGNAYSDEILLRAKLSPIQHSRKLSPEELSRLLIATRDVLNEWIERLLKQTGDRFPGKVTAFRPEMVAHGKFGEPCPQCGSPIQRIVYSENETNYCARCQNGGKVLADRSLSRLLKSDWPRQIEDWEA